jgi:hypothetical protein
MSAVDQAALGRVLSGALDGAAPIEITSREPLKPAVQRVRLLAAGRARSVIVKRLAPEIARRNQLVATRWLPAAGMERAAPAVLGILTDPDPARAWLVAEDLGAATFAAQPPDAARLQAAIELLARLHTRFAEHALLGEVRLWGGDLGASWLEANLRDATRALAALREPLVPPGGARAALRERLLDRLAALLEQAPRRAEELWACGGPETLLHGDLWLANIVDVRDGDGAGAGNGGPRIALIDWDHAAVGPPLYDVSTFLLRFPHGERLGLWATYARALGRRAWRLPDEAALERLCATAEHGRIANRLIWPALEIARAADEESRERSWADLEEVSRWLEAAEDVP